MRRNLALLLPALALAACDGESPSASNLTVQGLQGPAEISVLTADTGAGAPAAPGASLAPGAGVSGFPSSAAYFTDEQHSYVYDSSMEAMGTINEILGMTRQTAYAEMVNQGPYLAQIDTSLLETGAPDEGGDAPELQLWTVRSTRANNFVDQQVHFWVPGGPGDPITIFADMTLNEGASLDDPFGRFEMNFPRRFTAWMRVLRWMPDPWYFAAVRRATGA